MAKTNSDKKSPNLKTKKTPVHHKAIGWTIGVGVLAGILIGALSLYQTAYANKALPRLKIADSYIGGQTYEQIKTIVDEYAQAVAENGITISYGGRKAVIYPLVSAADDPDLTYDLFTIDPEKTAQVALTIGHDSSFWSNIPEYIKALIVTQEAPVMVNFNTEAVYDFLKANFSEVDQPAQNADLSYADGVFSVTGENSGQILDYEKGMKELNDRLQSLSLTGVSLDLIAEQPTVLYADAQAMIGEAQKVAQLAPLTFRADEETSWEANQEAVSYWLTVINNNSQPALAFRTEMINDFFRDKKAEYDIEMKEGKLTIENGKASEFQPSQTGREIDLAQSVALINQMIIIEGAEEVSLVVNHIEPEVRTGDANDLGIKEIIGVGKSDFSGSPTNRRKNIALGAAMLHGQLIEPDEEFSLVDALNHFKPEDGWLPELVIKGNKTIPEIGGGACQFGTTMFRATLNTGLPVTARRNHSYTVSYYYPIGTDATIYDPAPDYRFKNDTGHHILIQTRISGDELIFEFWGTKDGRVAEQSKPVLSNWVAPPEKKIVETTDLAPGQTKCTERAHSGVTASFNYNVTYSDGQVATNNFSSVYKPWQEVCLVGVAAETQTE